MATVADQFFADLGRRGYEPLLRRTTGKIKFETIGGKTGTGEAGAVRRPERWLVDIDHGTVTVSRRNVAVDAALRADETMFEQLLTGKQNVTAAVFRGAVSVEGDLDLLIQFQRLLPGPGGPMASAGGPAQAVAKGRSA